MIRGLLVLLLLLLPVPAAAADSIAGSWALRLDGSIIFRFDIAPDGEGWKGTWWKPTSFATDGNRFARLTGPSLKVESDKSATIGDWAELSFPDNRPNAVPDVFRFHLLSADRAEMIYAGTGLAPYTLERIAPDAILGPWEEGKVYRRPGTAPVAAPRPAPPRTAPQTPPRAAPQGPPQGPPAVVGR